MHPPISTEDVSFNMTLQRKQLAGWMFTHTEYILAQLFKRHL